MSMLIAVGVFCAIGPLNSNPDSGIAVVMLALFIALLLRHIAIRYTLVRKIIALTEQHMTSLVRRRVQLVQPDAYGKLQKDKWDRELNYFIVNHVKESISRNEYYILVRNKDIIANIIGSCVEDALPDLPVLQEFSEVKSPADFEIFCAEQLHRIGWTTRVTSRSWDQGSDVVTEKNGVRITIQCKLYQRPVGNKAVQEVTAARGYERAAYAAVVSNNRYTLAAEQLAFTNEILLLHYSDLQNLDAILGMDTTCAAISANDELHKLECRPSKSRNLDHVRREAVSRLIISPITTLGGLFDNAPANRKRRRMSTAEAALHSAARSAGKKVGRAILRGILGSISKSR